MKRILLTCILSLLTLGLFAQEQIVVEHEYPAFTEISLTDYFNVTLVPSKTHSVKITCDSRIEDYIIAYVKDGVLEISVDIKAMPSDVKALFKAGTGSGKVKEGQTPIEAPKMEIRIASLKSLRVTGNSTVNSEGPISSDKMSLEIGKTAKIDGLSLDADAIYIEMSQKAKADITADVGSLNVQAGNSSVIEMKVKAEDVRVNAGSFANVELYGSVEAISLVSEGSAKIKFETSSF